MGHDSSVTSCSTRFGPVETDPDKFTIERLTSREFDSGDYTQTYLVDDVLAECQPMVIAATLKTMKTTIAVALGLSLALARPFLGKFQVREAQNVLLLSGESGLSTLQSTGRRIAASYGFSLGDVGKLFWSTNLPRLGNVEHLEAIREAIVNDEIAVLICDPLYFMLPGQDAGNLMIVGGYLRTLERSLRGIGRHARGRAPCQENGHRRQARTARPFPNLVERHGRMGPAMVAFEPARALPPRDWRAPLVDGHRR